MITTPESIPQSTERKISIALFAHPKEQNACDALCKHLKIIVRTSTKPIEINSDFSIPPGEDINTFKTKLIQSDIVLALLSNDYIDDDEKYKRLNLVFERANAHLAVVLFVIARDCMWDLLPFNKELFLPKDRVPVENYSHIDTAYKDITEEVYELIQHLVNPSAQPGTGN